MDEKKLIAMEHVLLGLLEEASKKNGINLVNVRGRVTDSLRRSNAAPEVVRLAEKMVNDVPR